MNFHRHEVMVAAEFFGQHAGKLRVHLVRGDVEQRHHEVVGIDLGDMLVENEPLFHQQTFQRAVILGPRLAKVLDLIGREYLLLQQKLDQQRLRVVGDFAGGCHGRYFAGFSRVVCRGGLGCDVQVAQLHDFPLARQQYFVRKNGGDEAAWGLVARLRNRLLLLVDVGR